MVTGQIHGGRALLGRERSPVAISSIHRLHATGRLDDRRSGPGIVVDRRGGARRRGHHATIRVVLVGGRGWRRRAHPRTPALGAKCGAPVKGVQGPAVATVTGQHSRVAVRRGYRRSAQDGRGDTVVGVVRVIGIRIRGHIVVSDPIPVLVVGLIGCSAT